MPLLLAFAFLAGIVTVLSPCVLPVLPALLAASAGNGRKRPLGVITGLVFSFMFFTLALTALVKFTGISPNILRIIAIGLIAFFGLVMLFPKLGDWFSSKTSLFADLGGSIQSKATGSGFWGGFILGTALGLVWTPCAGPILAAITTLVATSSVTLDTLLLTFSYTLGTALPLFAIVYGGNKVTHSLRGYTETIRKVFGGMMILAALSIALHWDATFQQWALKYFPMINVENVPIVQEELNKLRQKGKTSEQLLGGKVGTSMPPFAGIAEWINSKPLTPQELKGNVVLVDFWTYSCINCVRTFPYLKKWHADYKDKGFVLIGVHTPEFEFEKDLTNVKEAVKRFGIAYPVPLDNFYATWENYNNRFWPAHYLIDQQGIIRDVHFGEGAYLETENAIRDLLGLDPLKETETVAQKEPLTPETYLGYSRAESYTTPLTKDQSHTYSAAQPPLNGISLNGPWTVSAESIRSDSPTSTLTLHFHAANVYLVMGAESPQTVLVSLDDKAAASPEVKDGQLPVSKFMMYHLVTTAQGEHTLTLTVPTGVSLYAFTFGGPEG